ncbi:beta-ketoacyl synthase chain length factor [Coralloluteibacterium stylophorae]|uniref:Beta-ketoacyl synthase chain length factor n=1 Tax=Coralloluteibacterium stylophorae TaxID=1776034 RepID=A0A8J8AXC9_9GAMM|nr:beta-ketoacyl synthase chain length factor [Coralloluteibacterium stylophorae]MBS7458757.1 beta-ketoacyl synthase chain length factor [Coralloluteibacterium stylophorae]
MSRVRLYVEGIGFWGDGLPGWDAARAFLDHGGTVADAPRRPAPAMLAPNERRRAPDTVAVALHVAQAACAMAGRDPATLASVFASTHGEVAITDHLCAALASDPLGVSPIRFHNSVHNAAAGYWTIGAGCTAPTTALSAHAATFAQALLEAAGQARSGGAPVLLVAYDAPGSGPLLQMTRSTGLLGAALVLAPERPAAAHAVIDLVLANGAAPTPGGALAARYAHNAMAPMLPLLEALAGGGRVVLASGPVQGLDIETGGWRA